MKSIVRLQITERKSFAEGVPFGETGPYERLVGKAIYEVDPDDASNAEIVDLEKAPRNERGFVEFDGDLDILKPVDMSLGNRRLLYDVNNRGGKTVLRNFNGGAPSADPTTAAHAGNGFLMREGYTVVWSGWQGDVLPNDGLLSLELPEAIEDGERLQGWLRTEFIADTVGVVSLPLSAGANVRSYESVDMDTSRTTLTRREQEEDERETVPADDWQFAKTEQLGSTGPTFVKPSSTDIYIAEGFRPGWIYELVYEVEGSRVMGLGMAAIRDLVSTLRHDSVDGAGAANPLAGYIDMAHGFGSSLCARVLRQFVYDGFNVDTSGRQVFEGIYPHVSGGGRLFMNTRFAQVGRFPRQHEEHQWPSERYPFAYSIVADPFHDRLDSVLKRPESDPLVVHSHTATEYWQRHASTGHTDPLTGNDLAMPQNVRMYFLASAQHAGANGSSEISQQTANTNATSGFMRAMLTALDRWATEGTPPPPSQVPLRTDETLVTPEAAIASFPAVPGMEPPKRWSRLPLYDYGPEFGGGIVSEHPPKAVPGAEYTLFVPSVDSDGNDESGLRSPDVQAPVGTYTGWSVRREGFAKGDLAGLTGSFVPFSRTRADRQATGDSRPSIEERYGTHEGYVGAVRGATERLQSAGYLLEEDAERYVEAARKRDPFDAKTPLLPLKII